MTDGDLYSLVGSEGIIGVGKVLQGNITQGIRLLEEGISRREKEGYRSTADWYRLFLSEVYLQIITGKEKPPLLIFLRNLPILVKVMFTASSRIPAMMASIFTNPQHLPEGHHVGHAEMILGLLYKAKKNRDLAVQHLLKGKQILSQFGQTPMLVRLDTALAELGQ